MSGGSVSGWMAEFFIPYKLLVPLNNVPPVSGTKWRANMYRIDYDNGTKYFAWQKIEKASTNTTILEPLSLNNKCLLSATQCHSVVNNSYYQKFSKRHGRSIYYFSVENCHKRFNLFNAVGRAGEDVIA